MAYKVRDLMAVTMVYLGVCVTTDCLVHVAYTLAMKYNTVRAL